VQTAFKYSTAFCYIYVQNMTLDNPLLFTKEHIWKDFFGSVSIQTVLQSNLHYYSSAHRGIVSLFLFLLYLQLFLKNNTTVEGISEKEGLRIFRFKSK
jgi:hypothetical protein